MGCFPFPPIGDDNYATESSVSHADTENNVREYFKVPSAKLAFSKHQAFASKALKELPSRISYLDASRPWLCIWNLNALDVMGVRENSDIPDPDDMVDFLGSCFSKSAEGGGGFGGGPQQTPHLAPTYATVLSLISIGTDKAFALLQEHKQDLYDWFLSLKQPDGSFVVHVGGEVDVRGSYCCIISAVLINMVTPELLENVEDFLLRCQTYEGGFACQPYEEAHGGYTFCAISALALIRKTKRLNLQRLKKWLVARQTSVGGFNGRTNKLVDSCYSFWIGASHAILSGIEADHRMRQGDGKTPESADDAILLDMLGYIDITKTPFKQNSVTPSTEGSASAERDENWEDVPPGLFHFDQESLQKYVLYCCQAITGGLRDKPDMSPDHYHTNYALTGWAISQCRGKEHHAKENPDVPLTSAEDGVVITRDPADSVLKFVNPLFSLPRDRVTTALKQIYGNGCLPEEVA
eukprot:TRINITY_DN3236_c0_g1_i3.p1 TRINITY_DN3236_c0_g1~~TRINITY_DN3236_c0_g1_i3.p1  ORF type:complete len:466 (+),score=76.11 TRINITY_DN3236_c0_g1_i3:48-1445(+)